MAMRDSEASTAAAASVVMLVGALCAIYMVSQFLRNSVGVIAPNLAAEIGLSAAEIGILSSAFFFAFTAAQLPLGVALDRFGPKRCMLVCAAIAIAGAVVFSLATSALGLIAGRVLLGLGSSCYLMAPLALYARKFPPHRFASLTGIQLGIGSFGTLLATAPLAFAASLVGWRATFLGVGLFVLLAAMLVFIVVPRDPAAASSGRAETLRQSIAGIVEATRAPSFMPVFLMHVTAYASFALVVGLWGGPYLVHVYGFDLKSRGELLLLPALTQILGAFVWGPSDRLLSSYKIPVLVGAGATAAAFAFVAMAGEVSIPVLITWLVLFGFVSAYTPVLLAHGKSLFPPHLVGRGMTVMNMGTMGGAFLTQIISGAVIDLFPAPGEVYPLEAYRWVFALQALFTVAAGITYFGARDPARTPLTH